MTSEQTERHDGRSLGRVLVVDDHPLFCEALSMTLNAAVGVDNVETANTLGEALDRLERTGAPDLILLDLNLPDVDGLDGLIRLKASAPSTPVLIVSSLFDDRIISSAIRAGANGFVPKHSQRSAFKQALAAIDRGEVFTPEGYVGVVGTDESNRKVSEVSPQEVIDRLSLLTRQQSRILKCLCEGKLNKQIAYELDIAEATVKAHITAILRKLKVVSRTQAVVIAQNAQFSSILQNGTDRA